MRAFKAIYGFHLLEMIVALSVLCSLLTLGSRYISKNAENSVNKIVASHLKQVTKSAQRYVQDNFKQLKNHEGPPLDFAKLVEEGYLAENFPKKNHYGQGYQFKVSDTKAGLQLLLITARGNPITETSLRQIADLAGCAAGYASVLHQDKIVGTHEGWILEGFPLETGHLASLTMVNEQEVMDAATFLRKTKFTDHPEYNEMQTDLSMLANNIHLMEGVLTGTLSKDRLLFSNKEGKQIDIYNDSNPYIKVEDSKKTWSTVIDPAEIRLESQASGNKSYIGNDRILLENPKNTLSTAIDLAEIRLESQASGNKSYVGNDRISLENRKTWSTVIDPAEIRLESQTNGNKSYVGNDKIEFYKKNNFSKLDHTSLILNKTTIANDNFLKIPFHTINDTKNPYDIQTIAEWWAGCNNSLESFGRLFVVGDDKSYRKLLCMCVWRPNQKYHSYVIINITSNTPTTDWP